jgi:DNA gyrase subunit A
MSPCNALLVVTEDGFGKRVPLELLRGYERGMMKLRALGRRFTLAAEVGNLDEVLLTSSQEKVIELAVSRVPIMGRKARGARVVRLQSGERVIAGTVRSLSR